MDIQSTPFIRNDFWPSQNELDEINLRINDIESDLALNTASLQLSINNVSDNLNDYKDEQANTIISNNIIVNDINANYAKGKHGDFQNLTSDNIVTNNLQVVQPIVGATLTDTAVINPHVTGGTFDNVSMTNVNLGQFTEFNDVNIKNLNVSDSFQVDDIYASNVNSVNVNANFGNIGNLKANDADIVNSSIHDVYIDVADVVSLNVTSAIIGNVISDNIVSNNIDALDVAAESLLVNEFNAPVNAFIENLAFNTINGSGINALGVNANIITANRIVNARLENVKLNINEEPVQTSALLGYDADGRIIPVGTPTYTPELPNNADYIMTDEFGTSFAGKADTAVTEGSTNLVTSAAVFNSVSDVNNDIQNDINNVHNDINNSFNIVNDNIYRSLANNNADATLKASLFGNSEIVWPHNMQTPTGNLYFTSSFKLISELETTTFDMNTLSTFGVKDGNGYAVGIGNAFKADGVNNIIIAKDMQFSNVFFEVNANGKDVYIEEWKPGFACNILMAKALHTPSGTFEAEGNFVNYSIIPSVCGMTLFDSDSMLKGDVSFNANQWGPIMNIMSGVENSISLNDFKFVSGNIITTEGHIVINNVDSAQAKITTNENASIDINVNKISSYLDLEIDSGTSMNLELNDSPLRRVEFSSEQSFNDHNISINGFNCLNIDSENFSNNCSFINSYSGQIMNNVNIYLRPSENFVETADMAFYRLFRFLPAGQINIHIPSTFDDSTTFYQWCNAANPNIMLYNDL